MVKHCLSSKALEVTQSAVNQNGQPLIATVMALVCDCKSLFRQRTPVGTCNTLVRTNLMCGGLDLNTNLTMPIMQCVKITKQSHVLSMPKSKTH